MALHQTFRIWSFFHHDHAKEEPSWDQSHDRRRYAVALLCILVAWGMRGLANPFLGSNIPYAFFAPAAMIAAWYGGLLPGAFCLLAGLVLGHYFFEAPQGHFNIPRPLQFSAMLATAVPTAVSIWIIELLHRSNARAKDANHKEQEHSKQLQEEVYRRERTEGELRLHYDVILETNGAESVADAFGIALQKICHFTGWSVGNAWIRSTDNTRFEPCPSACGCGPSAEAFYALSKGMTIPVGAGLIGRVWESKKPLWVRDVRYEPGFLRAGIAQEAGLKSAFFFPVFTNSGVSAVFEFFHTDIRPRDEGMIQLMTTVNGQLGNIILRKLAEGRLRENEQRLKEAQSIAHIGHWEWNVKTNDLLWSDELYKLFGVKPDHFHGGYQDFLERVHPEDRSCIEKAIKRALASGDPFDFEHRAVRPDGTTRCFQCHGASVRDRDGSVIKMMGTAQDVTEDRAAKLELASAREKLQEYASSLEKKVAERTSDLEKSVRQLESFCYTIAHDLRAPLRAMSGMSNVILEDYAPCLDQTGRDYAERIAGAAVRMDQLIQDLLTYGQLTHGNYERTVVNLEDIVHRALSQLARRINDVQAKIHVLRPLPVVTSNAVLLEQIILNLLDNALKFVRPGVSPEIQISGEEKPGVFRLVVTDNGIGIPGEFHQKIFRVFEKIHKAGEYVGTGIGLAIVSKAVERLGGQLGLHSQPGGGSSFWIELPWNKGYSDRSA